MAINVDLENYQYANDELEKTDAHYANAVNCIESVLNNLDYRVLAYVKEDLLDIKASLGSMDNLVEVSQEDLINSQNKIEEIENKASQANDALFSAVSTIGGVAIGTLAGGVAGGVIGGTAGAGIAAYTNSIDPATGANVSKPQSALDSFLTSAKNTVCAFFNKVGDAVTKTAATVGNFVTSAASKVASFIGNVGSGIWNAITHPVDTLKKVGASIANVVVGFVQGIGEFVEAIIDTCAIVVTAVASIFTGLADLCQWIGGKITGNENWESVTKKMWSETMNFVSTKYVQGAFKSFYEQTAVGKWLDANAYEWFKSTGAIYKVANGIGYIAGVIALTIATMGVGGTAVGASSAGSGVAVNLGSVATVTISKQSIMMGVTAATVGLGKNTQNAWADGASLGEGLTYGSAMALWEGLQMFGGATVNTLKFAGASGVSGQLLTTASHVGLDMIDGASAGFIDPMMQMIYNPNETNMEQIMYLVNYDENGNQISNKTWDELSFSEKYNALFRYNGGWATVGTGALAAGAVSFVSEIPDIRSAIKTAHGVGGTVKPILDTTSKPELKPTEVKVIQLTEKEIAYKDKLKTIEKLSQEFENKDITMEQVRQTKKSIDDLSKEILDSDLSKQELRNILDTQDLHRLQITMLNEEAIRNIKSKLATIEIKDTTDIIIKEQIEKELSKGYISTHNLRNVLNNEEWLYIGYLSEVCHGLPVNKVSELQSKFISNMTTQSWNSYVNSISTGETEILSIICALNASTNTPLRERILDQLINGKIDIDTKYELLTTELVKKCDYTKDNAYTRLYDDLTYAYKHGDKEIAMHNLEVLAVAELRNHGLEYRLVDSKAEANGWLITLDALKKSRSTTYHEFGHVMHIRRLGYTVPDNAEAILSRAKQNVIRQQYKASLYLDSINIKMGAMYDIANIKYNIKILREYKTQNNYFRSIKSQINNINVEDLIIKYDIKKETANLLRQNATDKDYVARIVMEREKNVYIDEFRRRLLDGSITDMFAAVFRSENIDLPLGRKYISYKHEDEYWKTMFASYTELMANYNVLLINGAYDKISKLRGIFGDELFDTLDEMYKETYQIDS